MKLIITLLVLAVGSGYAQQNADTLFHYDIKHPRYPEGKGPLILLDEGHNNFHTTLGRFRPFSDFLLMDGYVVVGNPSEFSKESLSHARVMVIANALNAVNVSVWTLPTPSAFNDKEIQILADWVKQGGSLFLIADHMPFPGAAESLAAVFGFTFHNGFAFRKSRSVVSVSNALSLPDIFSPGKGLGENEITLGKLPREKVTSVRTFTGQAFKIPPGATPLIMLDDRYEVLLPNTAWEFEETTTRLPADGLSQGAYLEYGKGRVVIFGEAAMFSAQIQNGSVRMGMNAPDAIQNPQFLLNIIHWLDRKLD